MTGPKSRYRGKTEQVHVRMTPVGVTCLASATESTGMSQGDYLEWLVRREAGHDEPLSQEEETA